MPETEEGDHPSAVLPVFAPAFRRYWQLILPRRPLVVYLPERE